MAGEVETWEDVPPEATPDQPTAALPAKTAAPVAGEAGRQITVRPPPAPKPPPAPIEPHAAVPLSVQPTVVAPAAEGQKPPPDETWEDVPAQFPGYATDIGKGALSGLSEGVSGLLGTPHDIPKLADYGVAWAAAHLNEMTGGEKAKDALERTHGSALRAAVGDEGYDALTKFSLPGADFYQGKAEKFLPVLGYKPQSALGRYSHEIAAFAPGALIPVPGAGEAGMAAKLAGAAKRLPGIVAPAVVSETAGHALEGTPLEPWARVLGAGLGSVAHIGAASYARPLTKGGQQTAAALEAKGAAAKPDEALAKLRAAQAQRQPGMATGENIPGSQPTAAQITGDYKQIAAERAFQRENEATYGQRVASQSEAQTKAVRGMQDTGDTDKQTIADLITKHLRDIDAKHELDVRNAQQAHELETQRLSQEAQSAAGQVARLGDPADLGERARETLAASMAKAKEKEQALWHAIDPHNKIGIVTTKISKRARNIAGDIGFQKPMEGEEKAVFDAIGGLPKAVRLKDVMDLSSRLKAAMRQERMTNGNSPALKRMATLNTTMENIIANSATRASAVEAEGLRTMTLADRKAMREARTATKSRGNIERGPAGSIIQKGATSDSYRTISSQVPSKVFAAGPTGGQKLKAYTGAGGGMDPVHDIVSDSLAREATVDGAVDATKLKAWQKKYGPALDALPANIREKFITGPGQATQALAEGAAARRQALIDHSKLDVAKQMGKESPQAKAMRSNPAFKAFEGAANPEHVQKAVAGLFTLTDGVTRMGQLADFLAGSRAAEGLKRSALDHVLDKTLSAAEAGTTEERALKPATFQKVAAKDRAILKAAGFDEEQLQTLDKVAADIQRQQRFNATKTKAGSDTGQNLGPMIKKLAAKAPHGSGLLAAYIALKDAREFVPEWLHGAPGYAAAAVVAGGAFALNHFRNKGLVKARDIYHEAIMNPDSMADLLSRRTPSRLRTAGRHAMYAGLAGQRHEALGPRGNDIYVNKRASP